LNFYQIAWLFLAYSFLGWSVEIAYHSVRYRNYTDRGALNGPVCPVYGVAGLIITLGTRDLVDDWLFLYIGSAVIATVVELGAGRLLTRATGIRWWDYSDLPCNLDGHICLQASLLWGLFGMACVKWGNPLLLILFGFIHEKVQPVLIWAALAVFALDILCTGLTLAGVRRHLPQVEAARNRMESVTVRLGHRILGSVERRILDNAPDASFIGPQAKPAARFAEGCGFYKLTLLFVIGAFLGDITETIFCRVVGGVWMSRSSLVWGPFSIVWGLAIALVTKMLYKYKDASAFFLFLAGTLLGGVYEYLCSVFTELVFGAVFWDYSAIPFNLGGRINLLYCFFWGFAAVAWFKLLYPPISRLIERLPVVPGRIVTWALAIFMTADMLVSSVALVRYNDRVVNDAPAATAMAEYLDEHFDDDTMHRIYPKAVHTSLSE